MIASFPGNSGLKTASPGSASAKPGAERLTSRRFLYRRWGLAVMAALAFFAGTVLPRTAQAQGRPELKRPENTPQEKPPTPPKKKPVKGPRAVGILQLTAGGKGALIPVQFLI